METLFVKLQSLYTEMVFFKDLILLMNVHIDFVHVILVYYYYYILLDD